MKIEKPIKLVPSATPSPTVPLVLTSFVAALNAMTGDEIAGAKILESTKDKGTLACLAEFAAKFDELAQAKTGKTAPITTAAPGPPATPPPAPPAAPSSSASNYTDRCRAANLAAKTGQPSARDEEIAILRRLEKTTDLVVRGIVQRRLKELKS